MKSSSIIEAAKTAGRKLVNRFGGRAEVQFTSKTADVFFDPNIRCKYEDIVSEAEAVATEHSLNINHVCVGGTAVIQFYN